MPMFRLWPAKGMSRGWVPRHLASKYDPLDVKQEAYLRALEAHPTFMEWPSEDQQRYLRSVLAVVRVDLARSHDCRKRAAAREVGISEDVASEHTSPTRKARRREDLDRLSEALARLPVSQARAIRLKHIEGLTIEEVRVAMGRGTRDEVASLIARGMRALRSAGLLGGD